MHPRLTPGLCRASSHFFTANDIRLGIFLYLLSVTAKFKSLKCRFSFVSVAQIIAVRQNLKVFKGGIIYLFIIHSFLSTAYSTFYIMGLILSMQIPFVGFQPIRTSEHMAAAGKFHPLYLYQSAWLYVFLGRTSLLLENFNMCAMMKSAFLLMYWCPNLFLYHTFLNKFQNVWQVKDDVVLKFTVIVVSLTILHRPVSRCTLSLTKRLKHRFVL